MAKFALVASTLLVASAAVSAQECSSDVSESFIATIDNSTYFNTCAEGTTFNVTSAFDVLNFTSTEFFAFCNSSACLEPLHELMGSVDCLITYEGTARNLSEEVDALHHECHEVLDAAEGSAHMHMDMSMSGMDMDGHSHTHSSGSTAASGSSSGASSVVVTAGSVVSAAILAVLLA